MIVAEAGTPMRSIQQGLKSHSKIDTSVKKNIVLKHILVVSGEKPINSFQVKSFKFCSNNMNKAIYAF